MRTEGRVTKTVKWSEVVTRCADETGLAKKQITDTATAIHKTLMGLMESERPKKIGEQTQISTPFAVYSVKHYPEESGIDSKTGKKITVSERYAVGLGCPSAFIDAANNGITITKKPIEEDKSPAKKEKAVASAA